MAKHMVRLRSSINWILKISHQVKVNAEELRKAGHILLQERVMDFWGEIIKHIHGEYNVGPQDI